MRLNMSCSTASMLSTWPITWNRVSTKRAQWTLIYNFSTCAGTYKYVHEICLDKWRVEYAPKNRRHECELCGTLYKVLASCLCLSVIGEGSASKGLAGAGRLANSQAGWRRGPMSQSPK